MGTQESRATARRSRLDLERLAGFPDFDFAHDVYGIMRHMDRTTGKLGGCFLPRCARREDANRRTTEAAFGK